MIRLKRNPGKRKLTEVPAEKIRRVPSGARGVPEDHFDNLRGHDVPDIETHSIDTRVALDEMDDEHRLYEQGISQKSFKKSRSKNPGIPKNAPFSQYLTARKARSKSTTAAELKKECRRLWERYCERPNKTRLRAVMRHCELMAESSAKTVKEERARCMRAARSEAKKIGLK